MTRAYPRIDLRGRATRRTGMSKLRDEITYSDAGVVRSSSPQMKMVMPGACLYYLPLIGRLGFLKEKGGSLEIERLKMRVWPCNFYP
jgi:hypothetical protein